MCLIRHALRVTSRGSDLQFTDTCNLRAFTDCARLPGVRLLSSLPIFRHKNLTTINHLQHNCILQTHEAAKMSHDAITKIKKYVNQHGKGLRTYTNETAASCQTLCSPISPSHVATRSGRSTRLSYGSNLSTSASCSAASSRYGLITSS